MPSDPPALSYAVRHDGDAFVLERPGRRPQRAADEGELLFIFESDLVVAIQALRPDLLFLHAGAVAMPEGAALLVGDSGAGKSTLTWSLVYGGLPYLSDELAPVSPEALCVHAYPRAIALKELPPAPFEVPPGAIRTSRAIHVPVSEFGGHLDPPPRRVRAIFFLEAGPVVAQEPEPRPTTTAEAAARLLANALNPLAHASDGLDAALAIASAARCFELPRAELSATCARVCATLEEMASPVE